MTCISTYENPRFTLKEELGSGSFSNWFSVISIGVIYRAYDGLLKKHVALKIEKSDKAKRILKSEYEFLLRLKGNYDHKRIIQLIKNQNIFTI